MGFPFPRAVGRLPIPNAHAGCGLGIGTFTRYVFSYRNAIGNHHAVFIFGDLEIAKGIFSEIKSANQLQLFRSASRAIGVN